MVRVSVLFLCKTAAAFRSTHRSIVELEKMTTKSENLSTPASVQQDFELATMAYCGLLIQENLPASERENHKLETLLDCLRILSERDVVQASFREYNPLSLKDYIRDLRRQ
ncbi:uncharacterized protein RSE6_14261 [Rhynchosporium secalis]|uniref:Uncharacterized protein n=1 Tax=Rhynchosporium secalis TaxID=38038 RepID=A0A1E1MUU5_RHYSE|nr:uncharacterized protein RSE6_14261 [Rhynchosporium secalis]